MKLTILLRRSRASRAAKTTKAGECCMGLLQAGFLCRLKNPFDGTNAKKGKTTLLPPAAEATNQREAGGAWAERTNAQRVGGERNSYGFRITKFAPN